jgi:hypothetical protein
MRTAAFALGWRAVADDPAGDTGAAGPGGPMLLRFRVPTP